MTKKYIIPFNKNPLGVTIRLMDFSDVTLFSWFSGIVTLLQKRLTARTLVYKGFMTDVTLVRVYFKLII